MEVNSVSIYIFAECFCEHHLGGPGTNGIMCKKGMEFYRRGYCSSNEWCTGPSSPEDAAADELCTKGILQ